LNSGVRDFIFEHTFLMETDFRKRTVEAKEKRIRELKAMIAEAEIEMEKAFNEKKFNILQLHASKK
jgi:N-glycosylase/DNA lyase